ncbi:hypothetical protein CHARACLAT_003427 [Characodon lateralis]|uniref:Uncharacterized protein n=1 Tax=Characodon lateralis TaxID=208331 RepID=A0ABU7E6P7_9TELE|nr:hypothetical protein [Characodon lateralis]
MGVVWTLCIPLMMVWAFKGSCSSVIATNSRVAELQHQQKETVETEAKAAVRDGNSKPGDSFLVSSARDDPNLMSAMGRVVSRLQAVTWHPLPSFTEETLPTRHGPMTFPTRSTQGEDPLTNRPLTSPTQPRTHPGRTELLCSNMSNPSASGLTG